MRIERFTTLRLFLAIWVLCLATNSCTNLAASPQNGATILPDEDSKPTAKTVVRNVAILSANPNQAHQKQDSNRLSIVDPVFASDSAAIIAERKLLLDLKKQAPGSPEYIETLKQLTYAAHYQCGGENQFWWKGQAGDQAHKRAVAYATEAIQAQEKLPISFELGQLYECAHITKHAHTMPWNMPIGPILDGYAAMAANVYEQIGDDAALLALLCKFNRLDSKQHLQKIELRLKIEGNTSVTLARDIADCLSRMMYDTNSAQYASRMARYTVLADLIFENTKPSERDYDSQRSLLSYAGRYFQAIADDKPKALRAYERLIVVSASDQQKIHYSNTIAAIKIELEQYEAARTQYEKTIAKAILSQVDPIGTYFGLCMLEQMTGHQELAEKIWRQHFNGRTGMNEIFSYPSHFSPKLHGYLRTQAHALMKKVDAGYAAQIVVQWPK